MNLPVITRRPAGAPATWSLTLTGCLTLIGMNDAGIAAGNTNLRTVDVRPGVQYLTVLHRALRARSLAEAAACIARAPRAAAHYYYAGSADGEAVGLECSARREARFTPGSGAFVHCNHALSPDIGALESAPAGPSSQHRQARLTALLAEHCGSIGVEDLKRYLADHEGGPSRAICRHGHDGVSTNAAVIMSPATLELHACRGPAHEGEWVRVSGTGG